MPLVYNFVSSVRNELFNRIYHEQDGEMSLDDYTEKVDNIIHEEIDNAVTNEYLGDVEEVIHEYGINEALHLYISEFGAEAFGNITPDNGRYSRCLLYTIIQEEITYSFDEYNKWCEEENLIQ